MLSIYLIKSRLSPLTSLLCSRAGTCDSEVKNIEEEVDSSLIVFNNGHPQTSSAKISSVTTFLFFSFLFFSRSFVSLTSLSLLPKVEIPHWSKSEEERRDRGNCLLRCKNTYKRIKTLNGYQTGSKILKFSL